MTIDQNVGQQRPHDLSSYTPAPLRIVGECRLDTVPEEVWAKIADHEHLGDWVPLVGKVAVTSSSTGERVETGSERVCSLTGMGSLRERFLLWDPPTAYVYSAAGRLIPTRDHAGMFRLAAAPGGGTILTWQQSFRSTRSPLGLMFPAVMRLIMGRALGNLRAQFGGGRPTVRRLS